MTISVVSCAAMILLIALQVDAGSAVIGWAGNFGTVEREKLPRQFWFSIGIQSATAALFAILCFAD